MSADVSSKRAIQNIQCALSVEVHNSAAITPCYIIFDCAVGDAQSAHIVENSPAAAVVWLVSEIIADRAVSHVHLPAAIVINGAPAVRPLVIADSAVSDIYRPGAVVVNGAADASKITTECAVGDVHCARAVVVNAAADAAASAVITKRTADDIHRGGAEVLNGPAVACRNAEFANRQTGDRQRTSGRHIEDAVTATRIRSRDREHVRARAGYRDVRAQIRQRHVQVDGVPAG